MENLDPKILDTLKPEELEEARGYAGKMAEMLKQQGLNVEDLNKKQINKLMPILEKMMGGITPEVELELANLFNKKPANMKPKINDSSSKQKRNDKCNCGSGFKYKSCCLVNSLS